MSYYLLKALAESESRLSKAVARARVVATSAVTFLSGLAVLVTVLSPQIAAVAPEGYADDVVRVSAVVVAWLATAVTALRRVTPVEKSERGIL